MAVVPVVRVVAVELVVLIVPVLPVVGNTEVQISVCLKEMFCASIDQSLTVAVHDWRLEVRLLTTGEMDFTVRLVIA